MDTVLYPARTNKARNRYKANTVIKRVRALRVVAAEYLKDYELCLRFNDNAERVVDFGPFLKQSTNPLIRQYLNSDKFQAFRITGGDLEWNDFDLVFPIIDLYHNDLVHSNDTKIKSARLVQSKNNRTKSPTRKSVRTKAKARRA